ncbi:hypothetical protein PFISCL1PPCAC_12460, partial [Pristionchus fissidentatus]
NLESLRVYEELVAIVALASIYSIFESELNICSRCSSRYRKRRCCSANLSLQCGHCIGIFCFALILYRLDISRIGILSPVTTVKRLISHWCLFDCTARPQSQRKYIPS